MDSRAWYYGVLPPYIKGGVFSELLTAKATCFTYPVSCTKKDPTLKPDRKSNCEYRAEWILLY
tara:strand:+ start:404 stop:592 length:189 start_codon:yes stop_codon:yes gene_type:complete